MTRRTVPRYLEDPVAVRLNTNAGGKSYISKSSILESLMLSLLTEAEIGAISQEPHARTLSEAGAKAGEAKPGKHAQKT